MLLFIYLFDFFVLLNIFIFWLLVFFVSLVLYFVVPKLFSSNVLIVVFTSFIFLVILMLYNIRLIILDIFLVHCTCLRLVLIIKESYANNLEGI